MLSRLLLLFIALNSAPLMASIMSKQSYTLAPRTRVHGPVMNTISKAQYHKELLQIILEESHALAMDYEKAQDHFAYWNFVLGSILLPFHESSNHHFRSIDNRPGACLQRSNSGEVLKHLPSTQKVFHLNFRDPADKLLPDCHDLHQSNGLIQVLHGADGSDLGLMQLNIRWHELKYIAPKLYYDVRKSVRYGLAFYKQGFEGLYRNPSRYPCIVTDGKIDPRKLVHAAWAGKYNSGNLAASCRWTESTNKWAKNDIAFLKNQEMLFKQENYPLPPVEAGLLKALIGLARTPSKSLVLQNYMQKNPYQDTSFNVHDHGPILETRPAKTHLEGHSTGFRVNVRNSHPHGSIMAPLTGHVLNLGDEVRVVDTVGIGEDTWHKIDRPYNGWVSGKYIQLR